MIQCAFTFHPIALHVIQVRRFGCQAILDNHFYNIYTYTILWDIHVCNVCIVIVLLLLSDAHLMT